jgi:hypothetical protein
MDDSFYPHDCLPGLLKVNVGSVGILNGHLVFEFALGALSRLSSC